MRFILKASTATSLAALKARGKEPPWLSDSRAKRRQGYLFSHGGEKERLIACEKSRDFSTPWCLAGNKSAFCRAKVMDGGLSWARQQPSIKRTIA